MDQVGRRDNELRVLPCLASTTQQYPHGDESRNGDESRTRDGTAAIGPDGSNRRFEQELGVRDSHYAVANDYSYATETGGGRC